MQDTIGKASPPRLDDWKGSRRVGKGSGKGPLWGALVNSTYHWVSGWVQSCVWLGATLCLNGFWFGMQKARGKIRFFTFSR